MMEGTGTGIEAQVEANEGGCGFHLATITSVEKDEFVFALFADDDEIFVNGIHGPDWAVFSATGVQNLMAAGVG